MWDYIQKGWDYVSGAAETVYDTASSYYEGSFLQTGVDKASDFFGSEAAKGVAGYASGALFGKSGMPEFGTPKGSRMSGGARSSAGAGTAYQATATDLGYTSKVQSAVRAAQNARAGSSIQQTVQRLQTRPAKGPLIQLGAAPIKVAPRSRG
jgi:hypothetical protein